MQHSSSLSEDDIPLQKRLLMKEKARVKLKKVEVKTKKGGALPENKKFVIPRKKKARDLFETQALDTRDAKDLLRTITQSFYQPNSTSAYSYEKVVIIHNTLFDEEFSTKKQAMRQEGYTQKEVEESCAYLFVDSWDKVRTIAKEGLCTDSSSFSNLGDPKMGVYLSRYPDLVSHQPFSSPRRKYLMVFKVAKGKLKAVGERTGDSCALEPTPNYDGHISKLFPPGHKVSLMQAFISSQYYFYEFMDEGDDIHARRPRQCCPYAVVQFTVTSTSLQYRDFSTWNITNNNDLDPFSLNHLPDGRMYSDYTRYGRALWSGIVKNKENILSNADLICYSNDKLPFPIAEYIDIKAKVAYKKLEPLLPSPIFSQLPIISGKCKAIDGGTMYVYCEIRPVDENNNKLTKLISYFQGRNLAGVAEFPDSNAHIYVIPTSVFSHHLGLTDEHYPDVLHALLLRRLPKEEIQSYGKRIPRINTDPVAEAAVIRDIRKELQQMQFEKTKKDSDAIVDHSETVNGEVNVSNDDNKKTEHAEEKSTAADSRDISSDSRIIESAKTTSSVEKEQEVFKSPPPVQTHPAVFNAPLVSCASSVTRTVHVTGHSRDPRLIGKSGTGSSFNRIEVQQITSASNTKTSPSWSISQFTSKTDGSTKKFVGTYRTSSHSDTCLSETPNKDKTKDTGDTSSEQSTPGEDKEEGTEDNSSKVRPVAKPSRLSSRLMALFSKSLKQSPVAATSGGPSPSSSVSTVSCAVSVSNTTSGSATSIVSVSNTTTGSATSISGQASMSVFSTAPSVCTTVTQHLHSTRSSVTMSSSQTTTSPLTPTDFSVINALKEVRSKSESKISSPCSTGSVLCTVPYHPTQIVHGTATTTSSTPVTTVGAIIPVSRSSTIEPSVFFSPAAPEARNDLNSYYSNAATRVPLSQQVLIQYPLIKSMSKRHRMATSCTTTSTVESCNSTSSKYSSDVVTSVKSPVSSTSVYPGPRSDVTVTPDALHGAVPMVTQSSSLLPSTETSETVERTVLKEPTASVGVTLMPVSCVVTPTETETAVSLAISSSVTPKKWSNELEALSPMTTIVGVTPRKTKWKNNFTPSPTLIQVVDLKQTHGPCRSNTDSCTTALCVTDLTVSPSETLPGNNETSKSDIVLEQSSDLILKSSVGTLSTATSLEAISLVTPPKNSENENETTLCEPSVALQSSAESQLPSSESSFSAVARSFEDLSPTLIKGNDELISLRECVTSTSSLTAAAQQTSSAMVTTTEQGDTTSVISSNSISTSPEPICARKVEETETFTTSSASRCGLMHSSSNVEQNSCLTVNTSVWFPYPEISITAGQTTQTSPVAVLGESTSNDSIAEQQPFSGIPVASFKLSPLSPTPHEVPELPMAPENILASFSSQQLDNPVLSVLQMSSSPDHLALESSEIVKPFSKDSANCEQSSNVSEGCDFPKVPDNVETTFGFGYTKRFSDVFSSVPLLASDDTKTTDNILQIKPSVLDAERHDSPTKKSSSDLGGKTVRKVSVDEPLAEENQRDTDSEGGDSEGYRDKLLDWTYVPAPTTAFSYGTSTPEHNPSYYSPISSTGFSDDGLASGLSSADSNEVDEISLSGLSTLSEYWNTEDEELNVNPVPSEKSGHQKDEESTTVERKFKSENGHNQLSSEQDGLKRNNAKKKAPDRQSRSRENRACTPGHSHEEPRGSRRAESRAQNSKISGSSRPSSRHEKHVSDQISHATSSHSLGSQSKSRSEKHESYHDSYKSSRHRSHDRKKSSDRRSRERSRSRSRDRESRKRRRHRTRSVSSRRRRTRSRSNSSYSSSSSSSPHHRRRSSRKSRKRKTEIDLSDEAVLLEFSKPEVIERLQRLLEQKVSNLLQGMQEVSDPLVNPDHSAKSRPFFGGISELIYGRLPEPETIVVQDPKCKSVKVKRAMKRPAIDVDGEGEKLSNEFGNIFPNCGFKSDKVTSSTLAVARTCSGQDRVDVILENGVDETKGDKDLINSSQELRQWNNDDGAQGDSRKFSFTGQFIADFKMKRRCQLLCRLRRMRARERVLSAEVNLARFKKVKSDMRKISALANTLKGRKSEESCGTESFCNDVIRELSSLDNDETRCKQLSDSFGVGEDNEYTGYLTDRNVVSMDISDSDNAKPEKQLENGTVVDIADIKGVHSMRTFSEIGPPSEGPIEDSGKNTESHRRTEGTSVEAIREADDFAATKELLAPRYSKADEKESCHHIRQKDDGYCASLKPIQSEPCTETNILPSDTVGYSACSKERDIGDCSNTKITKEKDDCKRTLQYEQNWGELNREQSMGESQEIDQLATVDGRLTSRAKEMTTAKSHLKLPGKRYMVKRNNSERGSIAEESESFSFNATSNVTKLSSTARGFTKIEGPSVVDLDSSTPSKRTREPQGLQHKVKISRDNSIYVTVKNDYKDIPKSKSKTNFKKHSKANTKKKSKPNSKNISRDNVNSDLNASCMTGSTEYPPYSSSNKPRTSCKSDLENSFTNKSIIKSNNNFKDNTSIQAKQHVNVSCHSPPTHVSSKNAALSEASAWSNRIKCEESEPMSYFSRNSLCSSEFDDVVAESRNCFEFAIKIVARKIWCKKFPDDTYNLPFFAKGFPSFPCHQSESKMIKSPEKIEVCEKVIVDERLSEHHDEVNRRGASLPFEYEYPDHLPVDPLTDVPEAHTPPSCLSGNIQNIQCDEEMLLDDDTLTTRLSLLLKSLPKSEFDILISGSPRLGSASFMPKAVGSKQQSTPST